MTTPTPAGPDRVLVDVRDMIVVHTAILREFRFAPAAVRRSPVGDYKGASFVAAHLLFLCEMLHHHHQAEDELLWPKLRARVESSAIEVIDEVEAQHPGIDATLSRVAERQSAWAQDPTNGHRDSLAAELEGLHAVLADHLELEERALLPLAAMVLTNDEWLAVGAAGAASIPKSAMPLVIGMFLYEGDRAVITAMLKEAPFAVRTVVPMIGPRAYARRARRIHGTRQP
ncbi:MAG: hemerythrin domain-containing protein [Antricoccus sp.]